MEIKRDRYLQQIYLPAVWIVWVFDLVRHLYLVNKKIKLLALPFTPASHIFRKRKRIAVFDIFSKIKLY